jgi:hypothetical protein
MMSHFSKARIPAVLATLLGMASLATAQDFINQHVIPNSLTVVQIEEDWELVVGETDEDVTAPQITTAISPRGDVDSLHAIFNLNHQALDVFAPGGMQLQLWNGDTPITHRKLRNGEVMTEDGETVTWTQRMSVSGGYLTFLIVNGHSHTWGDFGNEYFLTARIQTELENLNLYNPEVSVGASGVVFAGNRVDSLTLKRVRAYTADGQVFVIDVNINVEDE